MKTFLSRSLPLAALFLLPGCASLPAQDPDPYYRNVAYSPEELDNLVAPIALYPDALLAQILVAATFPDQIALAARHVRERGTRNIDDQGWDMSVKAVAYYPPVLNMLARDEDWTIALGQAYAAQSADVMDAVQRLREMAREQGNLVTTREHVVSEDRGRIIIVPANPEVIYVPTYDPAIVYIRPIFGFGFHTGYFSFGIGFPIGAWLVYEPDWWGIYGHRVYYHGWYGDGWRYYARRHFGIIPDYYYRPRYSVVNININIFSRRVNYINLDRRHRYVRRDVVYERHYRSDRDRYADRDAWSRDDYDRRGPYVGGDDRGGFTGDDSRGTRGGRNDRGNDRIGNRIATFDDFRPDKGGSGADARDNEPVVRSGFGTIDKNKGSGATRGSGGVENGGSRPNVPVFTSQPRNAERKSSGKGGSQSEFRGSRSSAPVFTSPSRSTERKSNGNGGSQSEFRGSRSSAPVFTSPPRSVDRGKSAGGGRAPVEYRSAPRPNAGTFSAPQRSVERKSGGGGGGGGAQFSRPTVRSAPSVSRAPSGGGAQFSRPSVRSAPSVSRPPSGGGGGGGKVRASGGGGGGSMNRSGGGKGRKQ